jgi:hypothetical protein
MSLLSQRSAGGQMLHPSDVNNSIRATCFGLLDQCTRSSLAVTNKFPDTSSTSNKGIFGVINMAKDFPNYQ